MYGCEIWTLEKGWGEKNWQFWTVMLVKILNCKEIEPVKPNGNQSWIFIGGLTDAEADTPVLWAPDAKSQLSRKDPDVGKIEDRKRRGYRGWDGWLATLTWWTWVCAGSRRWWRTGRPGMLQSMGSQRVNVTEWLNNNNPSDLCLSVVVLERIFLSNHFKSLFHTHQFSSVQSLRVQSLSQEDPLEKAMATHSSTLAWKIPWMEEPGGEQSTGLQRVRHDFTFTFTLNILWHGLSLGLEWKLTFSSPVATAELSKLAEILTAVLKQHHLLGLEIALLEFHHLH